MTKRIGLLTVGGDCPGSNAAIRGLGKTASTFGFDLIGFEDGFTGMVQDEVVEFQNEDFSGILTEGGTILGTSREHPQAIKVNGEISDQTGRVIEVYRQHKLDGLVLMGGSDAQQSAFYLMQQGLNVITLPLTIDNDLVHTDTSVGFDSAVETAAEAIDRLHSTAYSYHRIIIVEVMGHDTGWLTLGSGIAGGADVILIPEIPYDERIIADAIMERSRAGKRFSIVAVSEGALSKAYREFYEGAQKLNRRLRSGQARERIANRLRKIEYQAAGNTIHLANLLEKSTGLEARITILGYLQRGGAPTAVDRVLATQLGTACACMIHRGEFGVMVALQAGQIRPAPLADVAGMLKTVPHDHPWVDSARRVGTCLGD
ncbi:MAG TPA: ATP-dependent 6-phosphofructokinase [Anaerolineaceae bacterium]|nr:ATP-dependent 6-phosphofructokinase [Anaerolineaceae bacterium]